MLAQIQTTLENFGSSLTQLFGLPEDTPFVKDIGQLRTSSDRIVFTLEDMKIQDGRVHFTAVAEGNLPEGTLPLINWSLQVDGKDEPIRGKTEGVRSDDNAKIKFEAMTLRFPFPSDTGNLKGLLMIESLQSDSTRAGADRIPGYWTFPYEIGEGKLVENKEIYPLDGAFDWDEKSFEYEELSLSLDNQKLVIREKKAKESLIPAFTKVKLTTDTGQEMLLSYSMGVVSEDQKDGIFDYTVQRYGKLRGASALRLTPCVMEKGGWMVSNDPKDCQPMTDAEILVERTEPTTTPLEPDQVPSANGWKTQQDAGLNISLGQIIVEDQCIMYSYQVTGKLLNAYDLGGFLTTWIVNGKTFEPENQQSMGSTQEGEEPEISQTIIFDVPPNTLNPAITNDFSLILSGLTTWTQPRR